MTRSVPTSLRGAISKFDVISKVTLFLLTSIFRACYEKLINFKHSAMEFVRMDKNPGEMNNLNENYETNDLLARALVQLLPQEERPHISIWLEKLQSISGDEKALSIRNDYTRLLLLAMQNGKITEPFDRLPPTKDLPPLSAIMPTHLFDEMFTSVQQNVSCMDDFMVGTNSPSGHEGNPANSIPPHKFLQLQPTPVNGVTCYFALFSNEY